MQLGLIFPQTEIGADPGGVRAYAEAACALGYDHLVVYDHVLGADRAAHGKLGHYDLHHPFHEVMVLLGWLAAFSPLELATGVLVAPQRQTALIAKQAAEIDLLSGGGRLRLGIGIGWNPVEYAALGMPFERRGAHLEEQIELLRRLWCEESVTFRGRVDVVEAAGLAPLPPTRPIPIWLAATVEPALRRVGRLADGWFPLLPPGPKIDRALEVIAEAAIAAGRDPGTIGMEGQVPFDDPDRVAERVERWRTCGASHLAIDTMRAGCDGADGQIDAITRVAELIGLRGPN